MLGSEPVEFEQEGQDQIARRLAADPSTELETPSSVGDERKVIRGNEASGMIDAPAHDQDARRPERSGGALSDNPVLTFVPWIIFWIVAGPRTWEVASGCAFMASILLFLTGLDTEPIIDRALARSAGLGRAPDRAQITFKAPKILDIGTSAYFLILVLLGLALDRHDLIVLENYSQAISSAALGLIVVITIVLGHPFTEQYAREGVPEAQWHTPVFRRMMVTMSAVWAAIFAVMAILGVIAKTGLTGAGSNDLLNWYAPIGLVIVGYKFNEWYPARVQQSSLARRRGLAPDVAATTMPGTSSAEVRAENPAG